MHFRYIDSREAFDFLALGWIISGYARPYDADRHSLLAGWLCDCSEPLPPTYRRRITRTLESPK